MTQVCAFEWEDGALSGGSLSTWIPCQPTYPFPASTPFPTHAVLHGSQWTSGQCACRASITQEHGPQERSITDSVREHRLYHCKSVTNAWQDLSTARVIENFARYPCFALLPLKWYKVDMTMARNFQPRHLKYFYSYVMVAFWE